MPNYQEAKFINADGIHIAYRVWGASGMDDAKQTLICVHGLYRNSHDFDTLGAALAPQIRLVAIDMMGRGDSGYAQDVSRYNTEFYARDVLDLADRLSLRQFAFLGTSMGGMIGMRLAMTAPARVSALILNDVGPEIKLSVLKEMGERSLKAPREFARFEQALDYMWPGFREWGVLSEEQIAHLTRHSLRETDGRWRFHYDPKLIEGFRWPDGDLDLWDAYRQIACPVLVLRGARSAVLPGSVAEKLRREPNTRVIDVPDAGHAPSLMMADQIEAVAAFVNGKLDEGAWPFP